MMRSNFNYKFKLKNKEVKVDISNLGNNCETRKIGKNETLQKIKSEKSFNERRESIIKRNIN